MQKLKYTLPFVLLLGVTAADAGGFGNSTSAPAVSSARSVSSASDGDSVKLRGQIVNQQGAERYVFADNTGSVLVNVDESATSSPIVAGTPVEIVGQVDQRAFGQPQIEARSVTVLASSSQTPAQSPDPMNPISDGGRNYQNYESD
jgi:uncharacterized protein (TIGR00156 family)